MIREIGRSLGNAVMETVGRAASRVHERRPIPADLLESEDAYLAVFDAPGATSSDVQVRFDDDRIEVRVDRFRDFHEGFEMRLPGRGLSLDGSVTLPDGDVDADTASATLKKNGTLTVRVPKVEGTAEPAAADTGGGTSEEGDDELETTEVTEESEASTSDADEDGDGAAAEDTDG
jgi:HSP20 family molecular chaperone IbpA